MTNEEVVVDEIFQTGDKLDSNYIESLQQENTKLKAEIEQWQSTNLKLVCELTRVECENHQLKSELHQLTYKNCLQCSNYGKCSINDSFNITYCSDFKLKGQV